ncbi:MAG TPA: MarR family transcriptional regulator [Ktedonobacterales bacterium]|jgi:hypothetical protein
MADPERLTAKQQEFIEALGVYFAHYGLPRLAGRMLGLLMLVERPLTLDDMAQALLVSRASISTNIRLAVTFGYVTHVGIPGDRRDYYRFSDTVWERRNQLNIEGAKSTHGMALSGLATLAPDDAAARERLEVMLDFSDFLLEESEGMAERWRQRKRARHARLEAASAKPPSDPTYALQESGETQ